MDIFKAIAKAEWKGPLRVMDLKKRCNYLVEEIDETQTLEELNDLRQNYSLVIEQCKVDLPYWYYGNDRDRNGLKHHFEAKQCLLEQLEGHRKWSIS